MVRALVLLLLLAATLLVAGRLMVDPGGAKRKDPQVEAAARSDLAAGPEVAAGTGSDPGTATAPPRPEDPEALASWFEDQVMRELRRSAPEAPAGARALGASNPGHALRASAQAPGAGVPSWNAVLRGAERGEPLEPRERRLVAAGVAREDLDRVDWGYVQDVFAGRVTGIPDELQAGIDLQEMDAIGEIPAIEELREQERFAELRDLGFENETIPWPACLRTATCRRDRASSPP